MTQNTTSNPSGATLTEKELFARFLGTEIKTYASYGHSRNYLPSDLLAGNGEPRLHDISDVVMGSILVDEDPSYELDAWIRTLEDYAKSLRRVSQDFFDVCCFSEVEAIDDDEGETRYMLPNTRTIPATATDEMLQRAAAAFIAQLKSEDAQ